MNRSKQNTWRAVQGKEPLKSMEEIVADLAHYMVTYSNQYGYKEYRDELFIDDVVYGLGKALSDEYSFANGFQAFRKKLIVHLGGQLVKGDELKEENVDEVI